MTKPEINQGFSPSPQPPKEKTPVHLRVLSFGFWGFFAWFGIVWLVLLLAPNFNRGRSGTIGSVKANMHTLQTLVETYAVDWKGQYPQNMAALKADAIIKEREYWKEFTNPYLETSGENKSYQDIDGFNIREDGLASPRSEDAGKTLYSPVIGPDQTILYYYIYGLDKSGNTIRDKGRNFTLSNG